MNATDFISNAEYENICELYNNQEKIEYHKDVKRKNGKYELTIHHFWLDGKEYRASLWVDYNYKDSRGEGYGNCIGGGSGEFIPNDWEQFKAKLNERLKRFPDYDDTEQFSLF